MYKKISLIILLIIIISGCESNNSKELSKSNSLTSNHSPTQVDTEDKTESQKNHSLVNKLTPQNFEIQDFSSIYNKQNKTISYTVSYKISKELYNILLEDEQKMYFFIQYPESTKSIFKSTYSDYKIAPKPENGEAIYTINFTQKLNSVNPSSIDTVKKAKNYTLTIADKDKDIISHYNDIISFVKKNNS